MLAISPEQAARYSPRTLQPEDRAGGDQTAAIPDGARAREAFRPREEAVAGVADHLKKFWDPRMRMALVAHAKAGGAGLRDLVTAAVAKLEAPPG